MPIPAKNRPTTGAIRPKSAPPLWGNIHQPGPITLVALSHHTAAIVNANTRADGAPAPPLRASSNCTWRTRAIIERPNEPRMDDPRTLITFALPTLAGNMLRRIDVLGRRFFGGVKMRF